METVGLIRDVLGKSVVSGFVTISIPVSYRTTSKLSLATDDNIQKLDSEGK